MGMFDTTGQGPSAAQAQHAGQTRSHEQGAAASGAGPRADQRLLLGRLHPPLATGTGPAGRRQSLLPLRPRLDRDGPNMDPHIKNFETIREDAEEVVVKTGFETTLRKRFDLPMPEQESWDTDTIEKLEAFEFDDPADPRRFFSGGDNQIAGVGDGFERNSPAVDRHGEIAVARLPGLRQHDRGLGVPHAAARPDQHDDVDRRVPGAVRRTDPAHRRHSTTSAPRPRSKPARACSTASSSGATWPTGTACSSRPTTGARTSSRASRR